MVVCNVNIVYRNLKSENFQEYAQKRQRNYTFTNSASVHKHGETSLQPIWSECWETMNLKPIPVKSAMSRFLLIPFIFVINMKSSMATKVFKDLHKKILKTMTRLAGSRRIEPISLLSHSLFLNALYLAKRLIYSESRNCIGVLFGLSIRLSSCPAIQYWLYVQLEPRPFSTHCSGPSQHTQYDELSSHPERKGGGRGRVHRKCPLFGCV